MKTFQKSFMLVMIFITMWSINSQAQNRLRVLNDGVAIGTTTNDGYKLRIVGNGIGLDNNALIAFKDQTGNFYHQVRAIGNDLVLNSTYANATGKIKFQTGGVDRMNLNYNGTLEFNGAFSSASGNTGYRLLFYDDPTYFNYNTGFGQSSNKDIWFNAHEGTFKFLWANNNRVTINLTANTSTPVLNVTGQTFLDNGSAGVLRLNGAYGVGAGQIATSLSFGGDGVQYGAMVWKPNETEFQLLQSGSDPYGLSGSALANLKVSSICFSSQNQCSDFRFKKDIKTIDQNAVAKLSKVRGTTYNWRTEEFKDRGFKQTKQMGFIAQELMKVYPELVEKQPDGYYSVNYTGLIPVLVEAIKQQQKTIDGQQEKITDLETANAKIKAQLDKINSLEQRLKALETGNKTLNK